MGSPWDPRVVPAQPAPPGPECTELPGPNSTQDWEPTAETPQHTAIGPRLYGTRPISNSAPTDPTAVETHSLHLWPGCRGAGRHLRASHRWKPDPRPPPSPPSGFTFPRPAVSVSRQNAVRCGEGRCGGAPPVRAVPEPPPPPSSPPLPNHHRCGPAPQECGPSPRSALIWANGAKRPRSPPASGDPPRPRTSLPAPHVRSGPASLLQTPPPRASRKCRCGGVTHSPAVCSSEKSHCGESAAVSGHRTELNPRHRTAPHPPALGAPPIPAPPTPPGTLLPPPPTSSSIASRPPSRASPRRTMAAPHRTAPHRSGPAPLWAAAAGTELCTA